MNKEKIEALTQQTMIEDVTIEALESFDFASQNGEEMVYKGELDARLIRAMMLGYLENRKSSVVFSTKNGYRRVKEVILDFSLNSLVLMGNHTLPLNSVVAVDYLTNKNN